MLTVSEIVVAHIEKAGYTVRQLDLMLGMQNHLYTSIDKNSWTKEKLKKISDVIGVDLTSLANAKWGGN